MWSLENLRLANKFTIGTCATLIFPSNEFSHTFTWASKFWIDRNLKIITWFFSHISKLVIHRSGIFIFLFIFPHKSIAIDFWMEILCQLKIYDEINVGRLQNYTIKSDKNIKISNFILVPVNFFNFMKITRDLTIGK